jgi:hypothetical protein
LIGLSVTAFAEDGLIIERERRGERTGRRYDHSGGACRARAWSLEEDRGLRHERVTPDKATGGAFGAALSFSEQKSWYLSPLIVNPENTLRGDPHSLQFRPLSATLPTSRFYWYMGRHHNAVQYRTPHPQPCKARLVEGRSLLLSLIMQAVAMLVAWPIPSASCPARWSRMYYHARIGNRGGLGGMEKMLELPAKTT